MRLSIDRNELWRGIDTVMEAVSNKPAMPVLSNILLEADGDVLLLAATDLEISIQTEVEAEVEEYGRTTVSARKLAEIIREWPEADVTIDADEERLEISGILSDDDRKGRYSMAVLPPDDFPELPTTLDGAVLTLRGGNDEVDILADMIDKTVFAVSEDDTRPVFCGVLWHVDSHGMEMVSTDGARLSRYALDLDLFGQLEGDQEATAIVPPDTLTQVVKMIGDGKSDVIVTLGEKQVLFDIGRTHLMSRLIEGPYVNYSQVIPQNNSKELRVASEDIIPAVRRVSILSSSFTRQIRLKLTPGEIELSTSSPELSGKATETVPAHYDHDEMDVGYSAQYLLEALRKMNTKEVVFHLDKALTTAILQPADQRDGVDFFCLLMPLRPVENR